MSHPFPFMTFWRRVRGSETGSIVRLKTPGVSLSDVTSQPNLARVEGACIIAAPPPRSRATLTPSALRSPNLSSRSSSYLERDLSLTIRSPGSWLLPSPVKM